LIFRIPDIYSKIINIQAWYKRRDLTDRRGINIFIFGTLFVAILYYSPTDNKYTIHTVSGIKTALKQCFQHIPATKLLNPEQLFRKSMFKH